MKKNHLKQSLLTILISLLLITNTLFSRALQLGNMSYGHAPSVSLIKTVTRSAGFFRVVGGVAFESNATGKNGLSVYDMTYDKKALDGDRLKIVLMTSSGNKINVTGEIPDWELIPIANFSDSQYGSAMTLFGELEDKNQSKTVLEQRGRIINYHPAFQNTLVGLRLLQADILIFQENGTDLFKSDGKYILGKGEIAPNVPKNRENFEKMSNWLYEQNIQGNSYSSYVVGDLDQKITFEAKDGKISFSGKPYWAMWKNRYTEQREKDLKSYEQLELDQGILDAINIYTKLEESGLKYEELSDEGKETYLLSIKIIDTYLKTKEDEEAFAERLKSYDSNSTEQLITRLLKEEEPKVELLPKFSQLASDKVYELNGINPAIYNTLKSVMYYSSLFRHFKNNHPKRFKKFLKSLENVALTPEVETPTIQYAPKRSRR